MDEQEISYINVIPFIDIMLVLLTIVLATSTFIAQGSVALELPRVKASSQASSLKSVSIEIDREGSLYLNTTRTTLAALERSIRGIPPETPVSIRAHRGIALQVFVDVMDVVKNSGFKKLSLQTEVKK